MSTRFAEYTVEYFNRLGTSMGTIQYFHKLEYAKKENEIGYLYIDVPNIYPINFFEIDGYFVVHRKIGALPDYVELNAMWYIRLVRTKYDKGISLVHIACRDAVDIVDRRIVAYDCASDYSNKTDQGDAMMKAIMRENFGSLATDSNRDISDFLSIEDDDTNSACPEITKEFCRRKVLPLLQDIVEEVKANDFYIAFDVVYGATGIPQFKTYTGQRGVYKGITSESSFVFSIERGNLEYATIAYDHLEEYNYIYAGGRGKDDDRVIAVAYDEDWIALSPINRREDWIDAGDKESYENVLSEATMRLQEAGPKVSVNGHIIQTIDSIYGYHYNFGDVCVFMFEGKSLDIHLDSVHVTVTGNDNEDIQIYTRNLDDTEY